MELDKSIQSTLQLKKLYFEKIFFEGNGEHPKKLKTNFRSENEELDENTVRVKLYCNVVAEEKQIIQIILVGEFKNDEKNIELRKEINNANTVAIMFPYLRAEMSLITSQPNFPTLSIPVVNINALIEAQKNNDIK